MGVTINLNAGDALLYGATSIYVSVQASRNGHKRAVIALWVAAAVLNGLHAWLRGRAHDKRAKFYDELTKKLKRAP